MIATYRQTTIGVLSSLSGVIRLFAEISAVTNWIVAPTALVCHQLKIDIVMM